ncbi:MAG: HD domain-containing protein [Lachnospiraceae bacterium]|nr:HD domain-containing protein [Lachnospiraceae bacterium]
MTTIAEIMKNMIAYSNGNLHDINHFIKVWGYAKTIGELEGLDKETQYILEIAAIIHDIACPLCREKYGNTNGKYQEEEGKILTAEFLKDTDLTEEEISRVAYLVGHHHTFSEIDGEDYQILIEADYLVNADESKYSSENIENFCHKIFKTETGICLLKSIYGD